jgi:hypothetical protein
MEKIRLKIFTALCMSALLFSCETKPKHIHYKFAEDIMASKSFVYVDNPDVVTIDNEKSETIPYEKINDVLKDVKYIPLISKEPIGEVFKILIHKKRIYVLDAFIAEKIFIFNMKGEIIKIIDSKGGGPNEYHGLMDMTISSQDDYLVIADRLAPFVLYFTLDGEFVKKTRGIVNTTVEIVDGKFLNQLNSGQSFDDDVNYHLVVSIGDSVIRKGFPFYPLQIGAAFRPPFRYNYKNELLFCPHYCDTVYQIINEAVYTAKYTVKHRKSIWEEKYNERMSFDDYERLILQSDYTALTKPVLETENLVCYSIEAKMILNEKYYRQHYAYWFDKKKKTSFTLGQYDKDIYHIIPFSPMAIYGNHYAGIIPSILLENMREGIKGEKWGRNYHNQELRDMIMDENPDLEAILVLYEFKDSW